MTRTGLADPKSRVSIVGKEISRGPPVTPDRLLFTGFMLIWLGGWCWYQYLVACDRARKAKRV